jgi:beta-glucosidase
VAAARAARTAVVFAYDLGSEGTDRSTLALPDDQDALIRAVARANRRTVVVLNTGDPVLMPWRQSVRSILEMWYPGQEGGTATADVLMGRADPGGRLPETFPRRVQDAPTNTPQRYPGVNGQEQYSEGIFVGYRWYDKQHISPLFAFGHGLSYTRFAYSRLRVTHAGQGLRVRFFVRNVGTRRGVAVPQVYVGPPGHPPVPMAVRSLAAFTRVTLKPGRRARVTLRIAPRQLSFWSVAGHKWVIAGGRRTVSVGASSRDLRLRRAIIV